MQILRITGVWLVALTIASFFYGGGGKDFLAVFLTYGFFMTLPALVILAVLARIEDMLVRRGHPVAALSSGPILGLVVPALLYLVASNKSNASAALTLIVPITLGTGLLWAASGLLFPRGSR